MLIDHHTHTYPYSFDGVQTLKQLAGVLKAKRLSGVCITDHYDQNMRYIDDREAVFNVDRYALDIGRLQKEHPDLTILMGIELGYLPHLKEKFNRLINRYPFDSVILSLHILDGKDPYDDPSVYACGKTRLYNRYLEYLTAIVLNGPDFDILGHFDYICRYVPWPDLKITWAEHKVQLAALARALVNKGKALEINMATVALLRRKGYSPQDSWPDSTFISYYRQLGGKKICLASDAHDCADVGLYFEEALVWLKSLGFKALTHYRKRQAVFSSLSAITPPAKTT